MKRINIFLSQMTIVLYGHPVSQPTRSVMWALAIHNVEYKMVTKGWHSVFFFRAPQLVFFFFSINLQFVFAFPFKGGIWGNAEWPAAWVLVFGGLWGPKEWMLLITPLVSTKSKR